MEQTSPLPDEPEPARGDVSLPKPLAGLNPTQVALLPLIGGAVILLLLVLSAIWLAAQTSRNSEVATHERAVRNAAGSILRGLLDAETGQRGYLLTSDEKYLGPYEVADDAVGKSIADLKQSITATRESDIDVAALAELAQRKLDELRETIELAKSGDTAGAMSKVRSDEGKLLMDEIRSMLNRVIDKAETQIRTSLANLNNASDSLIWTTSLGALLILGAAILAIRTVAQNTGELISAQTALSQLNEELEERVADRTRSLTEANEEIQRFAYIVSHDLRAPLVNIMGFTSELETSTETLKNHFSDDPQVSVTKEAAAAIARDDIPESLSFIRSSSAKMDSLIGAILRLSREGRRELKRERVALSEIVDQAAASINHQFTEADASVEIAHPLPSIVSDRLAIEQIVGNLLDNAVKYLDPNRKGIIRVTSEETGGRVKLFVADNGRGIDSKDLSRIFDLFRRAGVQDRPGEGIGLAHVRSLVRLLEGDISVKSKAGEGTTFEVDLPKKTSQRR